MRKYLHQNKKEHPFGILLSYIGKAKVYRTLTKLVSILLVPIIFGAILTHYPNGWLYAAPGGGYEYVAFLLVALVAQALLGNGAMAAQNLLKTKASHRNPI